MRINNLIDELKKIDLVEAEAFEYGQGLDPLLQEFVYDVPSLPEEARVTRTRHISDYYQKIYSRSANVATAYKETRKWAMRSYVQHHIKKIRKAYGLPESLNERESLDENRKELESKIAKLRKEITELWRRRTHDFNHLSPEERKRFQSVVGNEIGRKQGLIGSLQSQINRLKESNGRDPYRYQDTHQERLIHSEWNAYSFRYDLEGAGDIFRELAKDFNDMRYIMEKVRRIEIFLEGTQNKRIYYDDSMEKAQKEDPEKLEQLLRYWEEQPTDTEEQELAKNFNIELVKGNLDTAKILLNNIKSLKYEGNQLRIEENKVSLRPITQRRRK
jgi:hypothetical protein